MSNEIKCQLEYFKTDLTSIKANIKNNLTLLKEQHERTNKISFLDYLTNSKLRKNNSDYYSKDKIRMFLRPELQSTIDLEFIVAICDLFTLDLDDFILNTLSPEEILDHTTDNRYEKFRTKDNNNKTLPTKTMYMYSLDSLDGHYLESIKVDIDSGLTVNGLPVTFTFEKYNKEYNGFLKVNSKFPTAHIQLKGKFEDLEIMLFDPDVNTSNLLGVPGMMLSPSNDAVRKPCFRKIFLVSEDIHEKIEKNELNTKVDLPFKNCMIAMLKLNSGSVNISTTDFDRIMENSQLPNEIKNLINKESKMYYNVDIRSYFASPFIDDKMFRDLRELINLITYKSNAPGIIKADELDNDFLYKFLWLSTKKEIANKKPNHRQ